MRSAATAPPRRRLDRQRYRQRIVRGALDRKIAQFRKGAAQCDLTHVIEIGHPADMVGRSERAELDLDELRRGKFELVLGLGRGIVTIALAEAPDAVDREFLLALEPDAGPGGKAKDVFGLDIAPGTCVLGARSPAARERKTGDREQCDGPAPFRP